MHGLSTSMLLLLHSSFMLSLLKMLLKGEIGGRALNSHVNYIVDHEKSWNCVFGFLWEPCVSFIHRLRAEKKKPKFSEEAVATKC